MKIDNKKNRQNMLVDRMYILGLSQAELARRAGISKGAVSAIIAGKARPALSTTVSLAEVLEMDERELRAMLLEIAS